MNWIPVDEHYPTKEGDYLVSFSNHEEVIIAHWESDEEGGAFCLYDDSESYASHALFVNAWMPLPKRYEGV